MRDSRSKEGVKFRGLVCSSGEGGGKEGRWGGQLRETSCKKPGKEEDMLVRVSGNTKIAASWQIVTVKGREKSECARLEEVGVEQKNTGIKGTGHVCFCERKAKATAGSKKRPEGEGILMERKKTAAYEGVQNTSKPRRT